MLEIDCVWVISDTGGGQLVGFGGGGVSNLDLPRSLKKLVCNWLITCSAGVVVILGGPLVMPYYLFVVLFLFCCYLCGAEFIEQTISTLASRVSSSMNILTVRKKKYLKLQTYKCLDD